VSELINRWFGRASRLPGALAYGLRYSNSKVYSHTWEARLSEAVLNDLWNRLAPMISVTQPNGTPEFLRWTFNGAIIFGTTRHDGSMFFVLSPKKSDEANAKELDRLLSEFRALRA